MMSATVLDWRGHALKAQGSPRRVALFDPVTRSRELARRAIHRLGHIPVVLDDLRTDLPIAQGTQGTQTTPATPATQSFDLAVVSCPADVDAANWTVARARVLFGPQTALLVVAGKSRTLQLRAACSGIRESVIVRPSSFSNYYELLRQAMRRQGFDLVDAELQWGPYRFESGNSVVQFEGRVLKLPPLEFDLAMEFFRNLDRTLSRERLYTALWDHFDGGSRALDTQVSRLRRKLDLQRVDGWSLRSASGVGYRLVSPRAHDTMGFTPPARPRYVSTSMLANPVVRSA
ncbi:MAG: winged helix-turn-helix domain-containing protein [Pseudomonadota bacterium]